MVSIKEGGQQVKMSKRSGKIVNLAEVIEAVGVDVARFFYLNKKADAHLDFDLDLALKKTEENPVYYVQYASVRIKSIVEKASKIEALKKITIDDLSGLSREESQLLKKIVSLKSLLANISRNYLTHQLTYYLVELAQAFHAYYSKHRVVDEKNIPQSRARLALMEVLDNTFELGLTLLGISRPEKM